MDKLYQEQEVADYLRVSIHTVRKWRRNGTGPSWVKLVSGVRYPESSIVEYLEAGTVVTGVPE